MVKVESTLDHIVMLKAEHGKGDGKYYGLGMLGKYRIRDSFLEGSLRFGRTEVNWNSINGGYDDNALYLGAGLGVGHQMNFKDTGFTAYGRYLYGHTGRMQGRLSGLEYQFKAMDSHRSKLGIRAEYGSSSGSSISIKPYLDLAWEHEFSGKAKAAVTNLDSAIEAPSIKGDTGVFEIGLNWQKSSWYSKLAAVGTLGVRRGVSGVVKVGYNF